MARRTVLFSSVVLLLSVVFALAEEDWVSEDISFPISEDIVNEFDYDPDSSLERNKRAAEYNKQLGPVGNGAYSSCGKIEGYIGVCKPLALCAHYYGSPERYNRGYGHYDAYKSCTFGYGYRGVCCPEVIYGGWKPAIINYSPKKYGHPYDTNYPAVTPHAIEEAVKHCEHYMHKYYDSDDHLGKDEDHVSYWGNGLAKEQYLQSMNEYAYAGYLNLCLTKYLSEHHGYKPQAYFEGGLKLVEYGQYLPNKFNQICKSYYKQCYPVKYRSLSGSCNNLNHAWWGASNTAMGRILLPYYKDNVHEIYCGSRPNPRYIRTHALPNKNIQEKTVNNLFVNFGQFITHDVTHSTFYQAHNGKFIDCCEGYKNDDCHQVSPKCYAMALPHDDKFYKSHGQSCLNFARSVVGTNQECALGYASPLNHQSPLLDCSLVYGHDYNTSHSLRTHKYGRMKVAKVDNQHVLPLSKDAECFKGAGTFCMTSGDARTTLQPGITAMQILPVLLHNECANNLYRLNPNWSDEKLYQECRRIIIAIFQHIIYMEYAPLLLGWKFMHDYGLLSMTRGYSWDYSDKIIPWTFTETASAAMRHHSMVYGKIVLADEYYHPEKIVQLEHYYNNDNLYKYGPNYNKVLRGYIGTAKRKMDIYYDDAVTDYLMMDPSKTKFGLDLASFNLHRGRDNGVPSYNYFRQVCGLKRATKWEDFYDTIAPYIVEEFKHLYKGGPDELDLYAGGVAETNVKDALVGPVFWCLLGYQYQHWKWGDRYFYTLGGHRHSFTMPQLDEIRKMSMASVICMSTTIKSVPPMAFRPPENHSNPLTSCNDYYQLPRINWKVFSGGNY